MTIFWDKTGPLIKYDGELLVIESLNPQQHIQWCMSRWEMLRTGLRFMLAARL